LEEDQDEMEQMKSDQESQLSQVSINKLSTLDHNMLFQQLTLLQKEFTELKNTLQEVQYEKEEAEKKISDLTSTISSLEHDRSRTTTYDNSEFKVCAMHKLTSIWMYMTLVVNYLLLVLCRSESYSKSWNLSRLPIED